MVLVRERETRVASVCVLFSVSRLRAIWVFKLEPDCLPTALGRHFCCLAVPVYLPEYYLPSQVGSLQYACFLPHLWHVFLFSCFGFCARVPACVLLQNYLI